MRIRFAHMNALILLGLLVLSSCTSNGEALAMPYDEYGQPQNGYQQQLDTYRRQGFDTQRYGPIPERLQEEQRRREREQGWDTQDQQQQQQRGNRQPWPPRDYYGRDGQKCQSLYGC